MAAICEPCRASMAKAVGEGFAANRGKCDVCGNEALCWCFPKLPVIGALKRGIANPESFDVKK